MSKVSSVEEYILNNHHGHEEFLRELTGVIREAIPEAAKKIAWGMPSWHKYKYVIHFDAYRDHVNVYVGPVITEMFKERFPEFSYTTRGIQLYYDKELPRELITDMAKMSYENEIKKYNEKGQD